MHLVDLLEIFEIQKAGPAIFAIDQLKNERHGINSVVDYATMIAVLCFAPISSVEKIDFVGLENGFRRCFLGVAGETDTARGYPPISAPFARLLGAIRGF